VLKYIKKHKNKIPNQYNYNLKAIEFRKKIKRLLKIEQFEVAIHSKY